MRPSTWLQDSTLTALKPLTGVWAAPGTDLDLHPQYDLQSFADDMKLQKMYIYHYYYD